MRGFCPLASGSKGNSIYVGTKETKILIDAGISKKAIETRLGELGVDISEIAAILITHEHTDHIQGLRSLSVKYNIPVLTNLETAKGIVSALGVCPKFKIFVTGEPFVFGEMEIHPFSIPHDTPDPVAFTIQVEGKKLGFCTDLGYVTAKVETSLEGCDYLYVEANHEPDQVYASGRPPIYISRVLGRMGHLSNEACGKLLASVYHAGLKHVHLAHLSSECNNPQTAVSVIQRILHQRGISLPMSVAPQERSGKAIAWEEEKECERGDLNPYEETLTTTSK